MNMLEHYLVPGYKLTLIKAKDAKKYKLSDDTDWVIYDGGSAGNTPGVKTKNITGTVDRLAVLTNKTRNFSYGMNAESML